MDVDVVRYSINVLVVGYGWWYDMNRQTVSVYHKSVSHQQRNNRQAGGQAGSHRQLLECKTVCIIHS